MHLGANHEQSITPFNFHGLDVRVITFDDGEPRFVLNDLCSVLAISNPRNVRARIDQESVNTVRLTDGNRGNPNVTVVDEAGMYEVVLRSDKPEAAEFRRWVTREVLPTIRRTGSYGAPSFDPDTLTRSDILQIALNAETERLALEAENKELSPKAEAYDDFLDATGKYGVGAVAKMLGTSQNKLFRDLRNAGVLISKGTMRNTPYQRYMHHFEVKAHSYERSNGEQGTSYTTYVQPSGIDFIRRKLGFESIDPPAPADAA
jgi:anti-repressor protein